MFTGIIEELGKVVSLNPREAGSRIRIAAPLVCSDVRTGDSISVNGVCLTAVEPARDAFSADVSPETLRRSSLSTLRPGSAVNLERALSAGGRLGGHIVQGHIDAVGAVESLEMVGGGNWWLAVSVPPELERYLVFKGSVAIDGISLTIAQVEPGRISVAVIPHTYSNTNLRDKRPGDPVNLEADVLAKYVEKMLSSLEIRPKAPLTIGDLREQGY
jgi:riboflavin synthase